MGALRPNQFGVDDAHVVDYVASVAEAAGEFLQIVNFNLADQQYAVAGTVAGLKALEEDAEAAPSIEEQASYSTPVDNEGTLASDEALAALREKLTNN